MKIMSDKEEDFKRKPDLRRIGHEFVNATDRRILYLKKEIAALDRRVTELEVKLASITGG
jgi:hypothetical protein